MGALISIIIVLFSIGFCVSEKRSVKRHETERTAMLKHNEEMWKTLVRREKHGEILQWLNDPKNFVEIQHHVGSILNQIWGRDVGYTVHDDAAFDIRMIIYFAEHGLLPSLYTDKMRVPYHVGDIGFSRNMTDQEFWKLKEWVFCEFKRKGTNIHLARTGIYEEWDM